MMNVITIICLNLAERGQPAPQATPTPTPTVVAVERHATADKATR